MQSIPPLVGHRGASHSAPENTLPSFRLAFQEDADRVEGDFWLTSDEKIVCIHDPTTARTAPHQPARDVTTSTLKELAHFDVGLWKAARYKNTPIPTLDEVLAILPEETTLYVEIKQDDPRILTAMFTAARQCRVGRNQLTLISFSEDIVRHAKQLAPELTAYLLHDLKYKKWYGSLALYLEEILNRAVGVGADGVDLRNSRLIDRKFVDNIRHSGLEFHVWTVNRLQDALRYIALGVDSITTDRPRGLREELTAFYQRAHLKR